MNNTTNYIVLLYIIGYIVAYFSSRKAEFCNSGEWTIADRNNALIYCLLSWVIALLAWLFIARHYYKIWLAERKDEQSSW